MVILLDLGPKGPQIERNSYGNIMKGCSGVFVGVVFLNDVHVSGSFPSPFAALSKQVQIKKNKVQV